MTMPDILSLLFSVVHIIACSIERTLQQLYRALIRLQQHQGRRVSLLEHRFKQDRLTEAASSAVYDRGPAFTFSSSVNADSAVKPVERQHGEAFSSGRSSGGTYGRGQRADAPR
ncbi:MULTISPECIES: hypothetical protein [unclassified Mycolicibacterium]|uniref:hypothetical protein n=1 Tax=unclassified Mycolicibacterium TaxID=2636767 RepID=UPI001BB3E0F0|nr:MULTISPECIES: hypothetical protein [unclassified Mycolicibacterium]